MARKSKSEGATEEVVVSRIDIANIEFCVLGSTPLIYHAMSAKTMRALLLPTPRGKKSEAMKVTTLKHDPMQEFKDSVYKRALSDEGPTRLVLPGANFKAALVEAAGRVAGATKVEMRQLVWVPNMMVDVYGVPELFMRAVRSADQNRTPDIRTRAILPSWAATVSFQYVQPNLSRHVISQLFSVAGLLMGVGDWRQQKGSSNYGQFELVPEDNLQFARILKHGGMKFQDDALEYPRSHDEQSSELFTWYIEEVSKRRDVEPAVAKTA